jgi:hypothetical protein
MAAAVAVRVSALRVAFWLTSPMLWVSGLLAIRSGSQRLGPWRVRRGLKAVAVAVAVLLLANQ